MRRNDIKRRVSVLTAILFCVVSSFLFFLIRQEAQTVIPDPGANGTEKKNGAALAPQGAGSLYSVNTTSDTVVTGACQNGNPGCSLRGAIQQANTDPDASTIIFAIPPTDPGCSAGVCTINIPSVLPNITTSMAMTGPGFGKLILRSTTSNVQVLSVTAAAATVTFTGLTISNGSNFGSGGGIYIPAGTVNVIGCTISGNQAMGGGTAAGIYSAGMLNVTNSTISGNLNTTGNGGGITNAGGTTNVTNSTISGNSGNANGGGIYNFGGGTVNVTNSTIVGNTAIVNGNGRGGGIQNSGGTVTVKNSIIAMNSSTDTGPDVNGTFVSAGFNLIGKTDGSTGFTAATDQTGTIASPLDPVLAPLANNGGPTTTHAPIAGSPAVDKGSEATPPLTTDQRGSPRPYDNPSVPNAPGGNGSDIGAFERQTTDPGSVRAPFDFDGDGKTDLSIYRPTTGHWWYLRSSDGGNRAFNFGGCPDCLTPADFTGDGKTDIAYYLQPTGQWFVLRSEDSTFFAIRWGTNGDIPMPADFDGDGKADPAVYRPSDTNWYIQRSTGGVFIQQFGIASDKPVAADYDGDGKADIAIWRPGPGEWWYQKSGNQQVFAAQFGASTDKATPGDYTGDGKADIAFWRPSNSTWYVLRSEDQSFFGFPFGVSTDTPAPGDYDGDGKFDATVFRQPGAQWFVNRSTGGVTSLSFGTMGDLPLPGAYVR